MTWSAEGMPNVCLPCLISTINNTLSLHENQRGRRLVVIKLEIFIEIWQAVFMIKNESDRWIWKDWHRQVTAVNKLI